MRPKPKHICFICNRLSIISKWENNNPYCQKCYKKLLQPKHICFSCNRKIVIHKWLDNNPYCNRCYTAHLQPKENCSVCGENSIIQKWTDEQPVCPKCYKKTLQLKYTCFVCNEYSIVQKWEDDKPICVKCYKYPEYVCSVCGENGPVHKWENGKAVCKKCYKRPIQMCSVCGKLEEIKIKEGPICVKCYRQPEQICIKCSNLKIIHSWIDDNPYCGVCYNNYRRKNDEHFRTLCSLRNRVAAAFREYSITGKIKKSCEYGIDYEEIIKHLGPCPGAREDYHIDHIKPLILFDFNNLEQIKSAFAPENHQWLTKEENLKKGSKY